MKLKRRTFLGSIAAAAVAPSLWIPRTSLAATPAFGSAKRLMVLFAQGGLRSHATFNAVGSFRHNPFGAQPAAPGTEWALGAACGRAPLIFGGATIGAFADMTHEVAVLPSVDHTPGEPPVIDHREGTLHIGTGGNSGRAGLLALIGRHLPRLAAGWPSDRAPPVEIGASPFGHGPGDYRRFRPISIADARSPLVSSPSLGQGRAIQARRIFDGDLEGRAGVFEPLIGGHVASKESAYTFARLLSDPLLAFDAAPEASDGTYTNRALLELFGDEPLGVSGPRWGREVALAVRFFQLGSPAVVITRPGFDFHDHERELYGPSTADLVRQLIGLRYLLARTRDPDGADLWSSTVVVVLSEFSRNNGSPETGFNSGLGSDHVAEGAAPQRNQAIALMGGPITARGKLLGETNSEMEPLGAVYESRRLLATLLDVLGIESAPFYPEPPIAELFS